MGRRVFAVALLLASLVVIAQIVFYAITLGEPSDAAGVAPYSVGAARKADRVVLIVIDSLPVRIAEDETFMPHLAALRERGASGVLWASKQTGTEQGIFSLATGMPTSAADSLGEFSIQRYAPWTLFDDLHQRGENVSFNGNRYWTVRFGDRGTHHYAASGAEDTFFAEDMAALENAEAELGSASPPALTVLHIGETDLVAHQLGTLDPRYRAVMLRWDRILHDFVGRVLDDRTAVIITSDHGNDVAGGHGGAADIYRRVPVIMLGAGIRPVHGFTMNSVDMPATLAVLLGTRLPGGARAKPATAPIDLTAEEEAGILLATYGHWITSAQTANPALAEPVLAEHVQRHGELRELVERGQLDRVVEQAGRGVADLIESLEPRRGPSRESALLALLVFLAVAGLFGVQRAFTLDRRARGILLVAIGAAEALLIAGFFLATRVEQVLTAEPSRGAAPFFALGAVLGMKSYVLVQWRTRLFDAIARRPMVTILVCFLFCSALLPLSTLALLSLCLLVACLHRARLPAATAALILLAFAAYFGVSTALVLPQLGDSALGRYVFGLSAAAIAALWLSRGPLRSVGRWPRAALLLLLILFPFGRLNLDTGRVFLDVAAAEVALGLLGALVVSRGGARRCLIACGLAGAALLVPSSVTFAIALIGVAILFVQMAWSASSDGSRSISLASLACAALCVMSDAEHVPSIVALFAVMVWASDLWVDQELPSELSIGSWAAAVVCGRYAYFELFGRVTSPAPLYDLGHVDVGVGLMAGENLDMARGTALVLVKMIVASWVVLGALHVAPVARRLGREIVLVAAAFMLLDVAHAAVKATLSVGRFSDQFDPYVVSLFLHTALFLSVVLGYASLRAFSKPPWLNGRVQA
jgi:hypothetical protein